jgi:hypothetical protein
MFSNLINAMRDAIKTETDLYAMRIQQQMDRYSLLIESTFNLNIASNGGNNYQEQIDELKGSVNSIMTELYKYKCTSVCSSDLDNETDILPEANWVINKVKPEEIKEIHINLNDDKETLPKSPIHNASDSPREMSIDNEIALNTSVIIMDANDVADNVADDDVVNPVADIQKENDSIMVDNDTTVVDNDVTEEETDDVVVDNDASEEEDVEEEELELEEIKWKGVKYYKDSDGNVYEYLDDGEVGESIGTMSKKVAGKVLLYAVE